MARTGIRSAAIIVRETSVLLMHRIKKGREYWVLPGGGVEDGETWEEALVREVLEETNMTVTHYDLAFMSKSSNIGFEHPFYFCSVIGEAVLGGNEKVISSEVDFYGLDWVPVSDLPKTKLLPGIVKQKLIKYLRHK